MVIIMNTGGIAATNAFLIADDAARQAALFDAPDHTLEPLLNEAVRRGWDLVGLWLTHGHFDHFADHPAARQRFPNARILIHAADAPKAEHPELQTRLFNLPLVIPPLKADGPVAEGQILRIGSLEVQVLHTPGHAPGHVCYYLPKEGVLIGGDLIIGGSIGRTDLPDSDYPQMEASLRRVMQLPPATRLLGGHGPASTLDKERKTNPFLRELLGE